MLLASAVDVTVGWVWHTAYRARWHWKLKREGALVAAGFVAMVGVFDTAHTLHNSTAPAPQVAAVTAIPVPPAVPAAVDTVAKAAIVPPTIVDGAVAQAEVQQSMNGTLQASAADTALQFPIIQDQTGSINSGDPIEKILPMDQNAEKDDPIARKINERYSDAVQTAPKKQKAKPVKTAAAKPAKPPRNPRAANKASMD